MPGRVPWIAPQCESRRPNGAGEMLRFWSSSGPISAFFDGRVDGRLDALSGAITVAVGDGDNGRIDASLYTIAAAKGDGA